MAAVVVGADGQNRPFQQCPVSGRCRAGTVQVQVVADTVFVALKVGDVDRIKTNQRSPQTDVRFRQAIARQVAMLTEDLLQALQRCKDVRDRFVIGFLAGGKPAL
jgi:hypothetical protein